MTTLLAGTSHQPPPSCRRNLAKWIPTLVQLLQGVGRTRHYNNCKIGKQSSDLQRLAEAKQLQICQLKLACKHMARQTPAVCGEDPMMHSLKSNLA